MSTTLNKNSPFVMTPFLWMESLGKVQVYFFTSISTLNWKCTVIFDKYKLYLQNIAKTAFCWFIVNFRPMHIRLPLPKAAKQGPCLAFSSASPPDKKRSGLNTSGLVQYLEFLWRLMVSITMVDPLGTSVSPRTQSSVAIRGELMGAGGCNRRFYCWIVSLP